MLSNLVRVVYDPEADTLHWAKATAHLRNASRIGDELKSLQVPRELVLADDTLPGFVEELRLHLYSRTDLIHALVDHVGASVESTDYVVHFINEFGDLLFFQQRFGAPWAVLRHSGGGGGQSLPRSPRCPWPCGPDRGRADVGAIVRDCERVVARSTGAEGLSAKQVVRVEGLSFPTDSPPAGAPAAWCRSRPCQLGGSSPEVTVVVTVVGEMISQQ
ncbi:hypothetical protein F4560_004624 [Saccharothrix ecbatanensis]|uniref:Uncharacterized protein n=1 Tax=Saccharothrix ecbatanensis TaxID=1105145 RepID=A0A7W9HMI0_9PSEU|nr:hypothetical protein [Saccharothrix ecbatanensis]MBB5804856.1 hypothetical protein [Saccharothrix ecbatanensis]